MDGVAPKPDGDPGSALPEEATTYTYSTRLLQPFLRVVRATGRVDPQLLEPLEALDLDFRVPVEVAHQSLETAVALTGNPAIGLAAARATTPSGAGAVNYVISSAATVRLAIEAAGRYMRLVNDAVNVALHVEGGLAQIRLENRVPMSRTARDFQVAAIHRAFWAIWASGAHQGLRVTFEHEAPPYRDEYAETFPGATIEFGAPFSGFIFDEKYLDVRLSSAEVALHEVITGHAERMLEELPRAERFTDRVRRAIAGELAGGNPGVASIAERFHMSPRTLERKLEREGTTFSSMLDDLRKRLALRYVGTQDLELAEIAFLLGFSQTTGFHRAFKRWTGTTPLDYRKARRAQNRGG